MSVRATYPWHQPSLDLVKHWVVQGKVPQAILLSGEPGLGVEALSADLLPLFLCPSLRDEVKRGAIAEHSLDCACCGWVTAGTHPDLYSLATDTPSVGVDEVRRALAFMYQTPAYSGGMKVVHVPLLDKLTNNAVNSLLKSVEEPTGHGLWLFSSTNLPEVLATLMSRCVVLKIHATQKDTEEHLQDLPYPDADKKRAIHWSPFAPLEAEAIVSKGLSATLGAMWTDLKGVMDDKIGVWTFAGTWKDHWNEVSRLILLSLKERILKAQTPEQRLEALTQSQRLQQLQALTLTPGVKTDRLIAMALWIIKAP